MASPSNVKPLPSSQIIVPIINVAQLQLCLRTSSLNAASPGRFRHDQACSTGYAITQKDY